MICHSIVLASIAQESNGTILYTTLTDGWHWSWWCLVCVQLPSHRNLICGALKQSSCTWQCLLMQCWTQSEVFQGWHAILSHYPLQHLMVPHRHSVCSACSWLSCWCSLLLLFYNGITNGWSGNLRQLTGEMGVYNHAMLTNLLRWQQGNINATLPLPQLQTKETLNITGIQKKKKCWHIS